MVEGLGCSDVCIETDAEVVVKRFYAMNFAILPFVVL